MTEKTVAEALMDLYEEHAVNPEAKLGFQTSACDLDEMLLQQYGIQHYSVVRLRASLALHDFVLLCRVDTDDPWYIVVSNRALEQQLPVVSP